MSPDSVTATSLQGRAQPGKLAVIFDGGCSRCRASMKTLMFGAGKRIEALDLQSPLVQERFPDFRQSELLREIHAVDDAGRVWRGADALREALSRQDGVARTLSWLWCIPGFDSLADRIYQRLAASRRRDVASPESSCPLFR